MIVHISSLRQFHSLSVFWRIMAIPCSIRPGSAWVDIVAVASVGNVIGLLDVVSAGGCGVRPKLKVIQYVADALWCYTHTSEDIHICPSLSGTPLHRVVVWR